ncbi:adhesion G-protein coupled receptor G6-like [Amphiura filiformis]|uniref:adhesion G-protein coupled receptor G6-like n=1 Tax=Amphiura filiformis TaxID=82378 RepID=UPI003B21765B
MSSLLQMVVKTFILAVLSGPFLPIKGSIQSLELQLHNPDVPLISGRSNKINFTATIHHSGSTPGCDPWELYMWISPTDRKIEGNSINPKQVINGKQQYLQLQEGKPAIFEHLTYGVNLKHNITCDEAKFLCGRFLGLGSNARCSSAVDSCILITCKAVLEIRGIEVVANTQDVDDNYLLHLNITIDYNQDSAVDISSSEGLWEVVVWLSSYSNGSRPRWSVKKHTLTTNQSSQGFIAGQQFGFNDIIYRPEQQELEGISNDEANFVCARFRSSKVQLESRHGIMRSRCTQLPQRFLPPSSTTSSSTTSSSATSSSTTSLSTPQTLDVMTATTGVPKSGTDPAYEIITDSSTTDANSPSNPDESLSSATAATATAEVTAVAEEVTTDSEDKSIGTHLTSSLESLAEIDVNDVNVEAVAKDLVTLTTIGLPNITTNQLQAVSITLQNIAKIQHVPAQVVDLSLTALDNILQLDQSKLDQDQQNSPSMMAKSLQQILANLDLQPAGREKRFTSSKKNVGLTAIAMQADEAFNGVTFNVKSEPRDMDDGTVNINWRHDEHIVNNVNDTGLTFLNDLFTETDITDVRANIIVYLNDNLFQGPPDVIPSEATSCRIQSNVIGAELLVNGNHVTQLNPGVKMVYNIKQRNVSWQPSCVFWDFSKGDWSSSGCQVVQDIGGQVMCRCNHLTNFAVLMSPEGGCYGDMYFLDVLSKIGCVVSIVALSLTFLTYMIYKNLMGRTPQLILIQWTLSLMCLYIIFLFGIDSSNQGTLCTIVAALLHYFTLTSVFWMGAEAASLFLVFVRGVRMIPRPQKFLPVAALVAWGLPAVFVIIPFIVVKEDEYRHSNYCFLRQGLHFYFGLLLPIGIVLLTNIVVFTLVLHAITFRRPDMSTFSSLAKTQSSETTRMIQQVLCIAVLLGITWVFGFLSIGSAAPVFDALFSIFNSFQGLAVFLLFCVRRREVREAWRRVFLL